MINIYSSTTTSFTAMGLAVLNPISASTSMKVNGLRSLTFTLPFSESTEVVQDRIAKADGQLYRILRITKIGNDKEFVQVYGESLFQVDMLDDFMQTLLLSDKSADYILQQILTGTIYTVGAGSVTGLHTLTASNENKLETVTHLLNVVNAELDISGLTVTLKPTIGADNGVRISKGRNLKGIEAVEDISKVITRLHYATKDGAMGGTVDSPYLANYGRPKQAFKEFEAKTQAELNALAAGYLSVNEVPYISYKIDMVDLAETENYAAFKALETVNLGDTVTIQHDTLGISIKARVLELEKDIVEHRNTSIVLGNYKEDYFDAQIASAQTKALIDYAFEDRKLNSATLKGLTISNGSINTFTIDEQGNVAIVGDVVLGADSYITWDHVTDKPAITTYTDEQALNAINATYIDADGVVTKNVYATNINVSKGKITTAQIENLVVGSNVSMGEGAFIRWANITDPPSIPNSADDIGAKPYDWMPSYGDITGLKPPVNADNTASAVGNKLTYIDQNGIYTGTLTAQQINAIQGITLGAGAIVQWSSIANKPSIPNSPEDIGAMPDDVYIPDANAITTITRNEISTAMISANQIAGGTITGLTIQTDVPGQPRFVIDENGLSTADENDYINGIKMTPGSSTDDSGFLIARNGIKKFTLCYYTDPMDMFPQYSDKLFLGSDGCPLKIYSGTYQTDEKPWDLQNMSISGKIIYFQGTLDFAQATLQNFPGTVSLQAKFA